MIKQKYYNFRVVYFPQIEEICVTIFLYMRFIKILLFACITLAFTSCEKSLEKQMTGSWLYAGEVHNGDSIPSSFPCPLVESFDGKGTVIVSRYEGPNCQYPFNTRFRINVEEGNKVIYTSDVGTAFADFIEIHDTILKKVADIKHKGKDIHVERLYYKLETETNAE